MLNWPYVNTEDEEVKSCFYALDKNSPENLLKNGAAVLYQSLVQGIAALGMIALTLVL